MKTKFTKEDIVSDLSGGEWIDTNTILAVFEGLKQQINEYFNPDEMYWLKLNEILDSAVEELKVKK